MAESARAHEDLDGVAVWVDHIVLAVPDVEQAERNIAEQWNVSPTPGGSHVGRGTRNVLLSLGSRTYLEVIGPDLDQPDPGSPRPFGVDDIPASSTGVLAGWALGTDDILLVATRLASEGLDLGPVSSMSRVRPDGVRLDWRLTLGPGMSPSIPFVIDWGLTPTPALDSAAGCSLLAMDLVAAGPAAKSISALGLESVGVADGKPGLVVRLSTPGGEVELVS
jgi:hypothetical protein